MKQANPINITHIDHVVLRVDDLQKMIAFYRDVLGCKLERGPGDEGLAQLRAGLSLIDLVVADANHSSPNMDHICFQIDPWDAEAVQEQLRQHGVSFGEIADRYGASGVGPSIYLDDPEGNTIELKGVS